MSVQAMNNLNYSGSGLKLTEGFEALRLKAYQDPGGVWTIGYGHTAGVYAGMVITTLQAEQFLLQDVQGAVHCVNGQVRIELKQQEFDALVDFVFNVGAGNFAQSTLLKDLNEGRPERCEPEFLKWNKQKGQVLAGLCRRRAAEAAEFKGVIQAVEELLEEERELRNGNGEGNRL